MVGVQVKRDAISVLRDEHQMSVSKACSLVSLCRSSYDYKPVPCKDEELKSRMKEVCEKHLRYGRPRIHWVLKNEGLVVNEKRTRRLYEEQGLQIKKRKKRKKANIVRMPLAKPTGPNQVWSMDFVHDRLTTGKKLKVLNVIDDFSKVCIGQLVSTTITGHQLVQFFSKIDDLPRWIRCDNGPEFWSKAFQSWCFNKVKIDFIDPGKPQQNAFIESFNGKFRDECLNMHEFFSMGHAIELIEKWRKEYNFERPHSSIGMIPPKIFEKSRVLMIGKQCRVT